MIEFTQYADDPHGRWEPQDNTKRRVLDDTEGREIFLREETQVDRVMVYEGGRKI